jgi:hypothetical protein
MLTPTERSELERRYDRMGYEYAEMSIFATSEDDHARCRAHRDVIITIERLLQEETRVVLLHSFATRAMADQVN